MISIITPTLHSNSFPSHVKMQKLSHISVCASYTLCKGKGQFQIPSLRVILPRVEVLGLKCACASPSVSITNEDLGATPPEIVLRVYRIILGYIITF